VNAGPSSRSQARWRGLIAVVGLLFLSGVAGFLAHRLLVHPRSVSSVITAAPAPKVPPGGTEAPDETAPPAAPQVPESLPDIALPGTDGKVHRLKEWAGRPLVVNFWATWCEPCRREIPLLNDLRHEHAANKLEIVGIAIDQADPVRQYASEHGISYPLLLGEREGLEAARAFGMETVLPFSVFADRKGHVVTLKVGELHRDEAELILGRIREVDAGRLSLDTARPEISAGIRALREARAATD
jgi:thiol-disulfide isomerase/thioredoxin